MQPGRYVVAISGGVDSVALLHLLHTQYRSLDNKYQFIVAHYDHGIRGDSAQDRKFVQELSAIYGVPFVYDEGRLGRQASEATARDARYKFLRSAQKGSDAHAIITAHHQDDVIETALLNLLRGTGRKGVTSLRSVDGILRPLLHVPKQAILAYAKTQNLAWREDSTNANKAYKRNRMRYDIVAKLTPAQRKDLVNHIAHLHDLNHQIDKELINLLHIQPHANHLDRRFFLILPHDISKELLAQWLRHHDIRNFDSKQLEHIVVAAKTFAPGQVIDINKDHILKVNKGNLALEPRDR